MNITPDDDDIAAVLAQVVEIGPTAHEVDLGEAVSRHVSARSTGERGSSPDPGTVAALQALGRTAGDPAPDPFSPLHVDVDFNGLLERVGEPAVWTILGKLKDLFA